MQLEISQQCFAVGYGLGFLSLGDLEDDPGDIGRPIVAVVSADREEWDYRHLPPHRGK
jgi:hypothetical protein